MRKFLGQLAVAGAVNANDIVPASETTVVQGDFTLANKEKEPKQLQEEGTPSLVISTRTAPTFYDGE